MFSSSSQFQYSVLILDFSATCGREIFPACLKNHPPFTFILSHVIDFAAFLNHAIFKKVTTISSLLSTKLCISARSILYLSDCWQIYWEILDQALTPEGGGLTLRVNAEFKAVNAVFKVKHIFFFFFFG